MELIKIKCENCGASLEVDKNVQTLSCPYCKSKVLINDSVSKVDRFLNSLTNATKRIQEQSLESQKKQLEYRNSKEYKDDQKRTMRLLGGLMLIPVLMIVFGLLLSNGDNYRHIQIECSKNDKNYLLKVDNENGLSCAACEEDIINELNEKYIDIDNLGSTRKNIKLYFENSGGTCN